MLFKKISTYSQCPIGLTSACGRFLHDMASGQRPNMAAVKLGSKKKCFAIAVVAWVALLLLLIIVWMRRDSGVNAVLSCAGFARLPESARNVRFDSQGSVFGMRVTLVRFEAAPEDMRHFVECSSITAPGQSGLMDIRYNAVVYPSWWPQRGELFGQLTYYVRSGRYKGSIATVGNEMSEICIQLVYESPLLRRIKHYIPFI